MTSRAQKRGTKSTSKIVRLPCACANLRRAARLVTQLYEDALRPAGITGPQFTLLQTLTLAPGTSQKQLAEILGIDSTTLTRTLALLKKRGWLSAEAASDRRALQLRLTKAGEREYERVFPYWQSAQRRLKQALRDQKWNRLINAAVHTAEAIQ
jgi:DNA-binding MarR family transcriptional regulator